jgi:alkylhydroperoxidase family enzyme
VIADARVPAAGPRGRAIAGLARLVTEAPWTLCRDDLGRLRAAGLDDAEVLHVVALSSFFGYLNRVADAVGIELDYDVALTPPAADASVAPLARPERHECPDPDRARPLQLAQRPATAALADAWHVQVMERVAPLGRAHRRLVAAVVADATGDVAALRATGLPAPSDEVGRALAAYADLVARAPWQLGAAALAPLRAAGLDDAALFDVIVTASYQSFASRLEVSLAALSS